MKQIENRNDRLYLRLIKTIIFLLIVLSPLIFDSTIYDPLAEVVVGKITNMFYGKFHNTMLPGRVVARVWNPFKFTKYAFFKSDFSSTLLEQYDPSRSARAKEVLKMAKKY